MAKNSNGPELTFLFAADIARFEAGINRIIAQLGKVEASINRASAGFNKLGTSSGVAANDVNRLIASLNSNKRSLDANTEAAKKNTDALEKLNTTMANSKRPVEQVEKGNLGVVSSLKGVLAGYLGLDAAIRGAQSFVQNAVEVGRYQKVLETASGSQAAFAKNTQFLESVADEYRLNVLELGKSFSQLTIATKGTALEGANTEKLFRATAAAASALQMSTSDVNGTFRAFIQMVSKGNVQAEELRGQLGERLVGAFNMAAKSMGKTTPELNKMLKDGKVLAADLLPKLAEEIQKTFGESAQQGAKSLGNNISYAQGQSALMMAEFGKATGVVDGMNDIARSIGDISNQARKAMDGPLGQLFKYLSTANSLTLGVLTGDLGRRAANGLVDDVRRKMPGYKAPDTSDWYAKEADRAIKRELDKAKSILSGGLDDDKKKKTEFEKLIASAEKLKGIIEDKALQDVKNGKAISIPEKTIEQWNKLYNIISKVAEATGANIPNSIKGLDEKLNKPLKNLIEDDGNFSYGRPEKWEPPKPQQDLYGGLPLNDFMKLEIDVEKLWKKEDIYKVQDRLEQLRSQLETKLIDVYGSLAAASEQGWGGFINSNKKGAEGIAEATQGLAKINKLSRVLKNLESELISTFGSLEEAAENGYGGLIEAMKAGSLKLEEGIDVIKSMDLSKRLTDIMQGFAADAFVSISEVLGSAMAGLNADEANKKIGEVFGNLLSSLGKALIAWGVTTEEVKIALKSMNGWAAIAAGAVAVAAGAALKATAQKESQKAAQRFWTGGIVDDPTGGVDRVHALLRPNEMVLNERQQNTLFRMLRGGYGNSGNSGFRGIGQDVEVRVVGTLIGNDIALSNERSVRSRKVHRGSLG